MHRVAGHDRSGQVDAVQQGLEAGDLVRLGLDVNLSQDDGGRVVDGRQEVNLPVVRAGGTAQGLAADRDRSQRLPASLRASGGQPAADDPVQYIAVDLGQDPADRGLARGPVAAGEGVAAGAEPGQDLLRGISRPLADRQQRGRAGRDRGGTDGEHADQRM